MNTAVAVTGAWPGWVQSTRTADDTTSPGTADRPSDTVRLPPIPAVTFAAAGSAVHFADAGLTVNPSAAVTVAVPAAAASSRPEIEPCCSQSTVTTVV